MTRPTDLPVWATDVTAEITAPALAKQQLGWARIGGIPERPPFQWVNWHQNLVYQWLAYYGDLTDDEFTQIKNIDSVTISNTQWGYLGATDQGVSTGDDVVFNSIGTDTIDEKTPDAGVTIEQILLKDGNLTVPGNVTINGTQFIANVEEVQIEDNLLLINKGEVGAGVTAGTAGIEVDRGSEQNYQFLFRESDNSFVVGETGGLQAVATREDTPEDTGVAIWNDSTKRFDTSSGLLYDNSVLSVGDGSSGAEAQLYAGAASAATLRFYEDATQKALVYHSPTDTALILRGLSGVNVIIQSNDTTRLSLGASSGSFTYDMVFNTSLSIGTSSQNTTIAYIDCASAGTSQLRFRENGTLRGYLYTSPTEYNVRGGAGVSTILWSNDSGALSLTATQAIFSRNIVMGSNTIAVNIINEGSSGSGVTIDGTLLKDTGVSTNSITTKSASTTFQFASQEDTDVGQYTNQGAWRLGNTGASGHTVISSDFDALIVRSQSGSGSQVQFNVNGAKKGGIGFSGAAGIFIVRDEADGVMLRVDGDIYNNTTAASANVYVSASNILLRSTSLREYKRDIISISSDKAVEYVKQLNPTYYKSKCKNDDGESRHIGLIAEEVEKSCRELAAYGNGKLSGVQYERAGVIAIAALKNVLARIEALEDAIL